ncbi:MAG: CBS domain-containing protein [Nitrospinae bacterium]|nr:CBS domain-containing protein [Nitrospinota bacterium]
MQVITTHLNADFDCVASMMAAKKLYPDAFLVLPGSSEKQVEKFLKEENFPLEFHRLKDISLEEITLLVMVDTHDPKRIGILSSLVGNPNVEVHVYDHHENPVLECGVKKMVVENRGACTTILSEILSERNIPLAPEECTLMELGIYQDTHSLTSSSTTPEDFLAAGSLLRKGADLDLVSRYMSQDLNEEQLNVFNELVANLDNKMVNEVEFAVATASVENYVNDLAYVVSRILELENLNALFVVVRMDKRIYMIARSRGREVNVSQVARMFGGGGHGNAASATIKDMTLAQAVEKLLDILTKTIQPANKIKDVMHFPVVSVSIEDSIRAAESVLTLYNLNTLPVLSNEEPVGLITRQIVEKAIHHKMERDCVEEFMIRRFSVTEPDENFNTIVPIVIEEKQKLIPVVNSENKLVGVVSRGDILREMQSIKSKIASQELGGSGVQKNVKSLLKERLEKDLLLTLERISQVANQAEVAVFAVGGFIRDLLLNIPNKDIDIVVEGDGILFANRLAEEFNARVQSHEKFGTSVVIFPDGNRIDVATARLEYYEHPAALPTVEKSSIKSDLYRRDFTINSIAVKLNGEGAFCLIDFFNGERDLKNKEIHVLHNLSFIEDPCRLFRSIRFEQRFGFRIGKQTEDFMKVAIRKRLVDSLSGTRLLNEIILILKEKNPLSCVLRMKELGLLQSISAKLVADSIDFQALEKIETVLSWAEMVTLPEKPDKWYVYLLAIFYSLEEEPFVETIERLQMQARLKKSMVRDRFACKEGLELLKMDKDWKPETIYNLFSKFSVEAIMYFLAVASTDRANRYANMYFTQYHGQAELSLTGDDLVEMGMKPGPVFQSVFKGLREAHVRGAIQTREEEEAWVRKEFLEQ